MNLKAKKKMSLFKKKNTKNNYEKLLQIPCDYDGYDIVFEENSTDPEIYIKINYIITNGKTDMKNVKSFGILSRNSDLDEFYTFYDEWTEFLRNSGFIFHLDNDISIGDFTDGINRMLKANGYSFNVDKSAVTEKYKNMLAETDINEMINYDVLIANTLAAELRKFDLELIDLFNGFDNCDFAVMSISSVEIMKSLEEKIKL